MTTFLWQISHQLFWTQDICYFSSWNVTLWQGEWWPQVLLQSGMIMSESFRLVTSHGNDQIMSVCEVRSIGMWNAGFVIGGPSFLTEIDTSDKELLMREHLSEIKKEAQKRGLLFVSFESLDSWDVELGWSLGLAKSKKWVKKFIEPYTRLIDLNHTKEEILRGMSEKWRYNVRYAQKNWVSVQEKKFDLSSVDEWYTLLEETASRDGFTLNPRSFFVALAALEEEDIRYFCASNSDWVCIASTLFIWYGSTGYYYYGASSSELEYRRLQSTYLLQYAMMCYAQDRGYRWYDFLGIAPPGDETHRLVGVSQFKAKFGGNVVHYPDAMILVIHPIKFMIYRYLRIVKNWIQS